MQSPSVGPTLAALRRATASRHQEAEGLLALDQPSTMGRYRRILEGFAAFLGTWEPAVIAALPAHRQQWMRGRSRRRWLDEDLRAVEADRHTPPTSEVSALARRLHARGAVFGSLYVMEGSALGGQVICRRVKDTLRLTPTHGAAYFHGHGSATGAMWREFRELLESETEGDADAVDAACTAATATFEALIAQMKACLA